MPRLWGKVLEKASSLAHRMDGPSLANLFWALNTANVAHGRTLAEFGGVLAANLKAMTPAQVGAGAGGWSGREGAATAQTTRDAST